MIVTPGLNALRSFATLAGVATATVAETAPDTDPIQLKTPSPNGRQLRDEQKTALGQAVVRQRGVDRSHQKSRVPTNKKELMANPVGRTLVEELEQLCHQIATAKIEFMSSKRQSNCSANHVVAVPSDKHCQN